MENEGDDAVLGNIRGRDESPTKKHKQKKRGTSKVRDPAIGATSEAMTHELPPQQVGHGEEGDGSASGHLDMRMDLTEAGLAALNRRLEVVEGNFSSLESTALEELGDVKEALDLLTDEHKEGLTNLELKLTEAVSALHGEVESLKQQLEAAKLAGGTGKQVTAAGRDFKGGGNHNSHWRDRYDEKKKANGPRNGCYLCKDPGHGYKDCPSLGKLSALIAAERRQTGGATQAGAQAGGGAAQERQDVAHLGHIMLGALLTKEPALE
ncbi:hypothetical protein A4A49_11858 [Nicotiana attenuata]|uniref:CCHC-type domain-containing protein n=1 Tax=Nicotiana attenuata TaxID=49451 RepID=A0A314L0M2_NICAT|nr:hypothetical protein A4A49_11858 [Nicotiana attenuata]